MLNANYTITKCSDETLRNILEETGKQSAEEALRNYNGKYKSELKVRKGHNLVPSLLRDAFASLIAGNTVAPTFKANYVAL